MKRKITLVLLICFVLAVSIVFSLTAYAETWTQTNTDGFGDSNNTETYVTAVFNGYLYAGTQNSVTGGQQWRTADGINWTKAVLDGFGDLNNHEIGAVSELNGYLYAGTTNHTSGGEVWRSSDGTNWTQVASGGFGDSANAYVWPEFTFGGYVYAGTNKPSGSGEIWRSSDGSTWNQVNTDGFGDSNNQWTFPEAAFNGYIYAGTGRTGNSVTGGELWRSSDGTNWTQANSDGFGDVNNRGLRRIVPLNGYLYVTTTNPTNGAEIWRSSDGTNWSKVVSGGFGDSNNGWLRTLSTIGGDLYAATSNLTTGAEIWRSSDGTTWTQINTDGFGDLNNLRTHAWFEAFRGQIYIGLDNNVTGSEVWRLSFDNTSIGTNVNVPLGGGVTLDFDNVSTNGSTTFTETTQAPSLPAGFNLLGTYYDISTDVSFSGPIKVTLAYDESQIQGNEADLKLFHWNGASWEDVTVSVDTVNNKITGQVSSLSPFALGFPSSPPTGVNTYPFLILSLMAIATGFGVMRKVKVLKV